MGIKTLICCIFVRLWILGNFDVAPGRDINSVSRGVEANYIDKKMAARRISYSKKSRESKSLRMASPENLAINKVLLHGMFRSAWSQYVQSQYTRVTDSRSRLELRASSRVQCQRDHVERSEIILWPQYELCERRQTTDRMNCDRTVAVRNFDHFNSALRLNWLQQPYDDLCDRPRPHCDCTGTTVRRYRDLTRFDLKKMVAVRSQPLGVTGMLDTGTPKEILLWNHWYGGAELFMGRVHPWVGLGWVKNLKFLMGCVKDDGSPHPIRVYWW